MKTSVNVPEKSDPEYDPATALNKCSFTYVIYEPTNISNISHDVKIGHT